MKPIVALCMSLSIINTADMLFAKAQNWPNMTKVPDNVDEQLIMAGAPQSVIEKAKPFIEHVRYWEGRSPYHEIMDCERGQKFLDAVYAEINIVYPGMDKIKAGKAKITEANNYNKEADLLIEKTKNDTSSDEAQAQELIKDGNDRLRGASKLRDKGDVDKAKPMEATGKNEIAKGESLLAQVKKLTQDAEEKAKQLREKAKKATADSEALILEGEKLDIQNKKLKNILCPGDVCDRHDYQCIGR